MVALARLLRLRNEDGQAMIEFALIVTLIVVVVLIVIISMGNQAHNI